MSLNWTLKDLRETVTNRIKNKFDCIIAISGERGQGKSTLGFKFLSKMPRFKPWKHQVYSRKDVIQLLESQKFSYIFDDEAITSSYKRAFYEQEQQRLIRMLNMYRDNFNIYVMSIPNFYSLDRDIRNLVAIHLQVIRRGVAIVHIANSGQLYSDDPWDVSYNKKIEDKWAKKMKKSPDFTPPYQKLTTFKGYLYYNDLSPKLREVYEDIKATKRKKLYEEQQAEEDKKNPRKLMFVKIAKGLLDGTINKQEQLVKMCYATDIEWKLFHESISTELKLLGSTQTIRQILQTREGISPLQALKGRNSSSSTGNEGLNSHENGDNWLTVIGGGYSSNEPYSNRSEAPEIMFDEPKKKRSKPQPEPVEEIPFDEREVDLDSLSEGDDE